jgi:hypothetical protein
MLEPSVVLNARRLRTFIQAALLGAENAVKGAVASGSVTLR